MDANNQDVGARVRAAREYARLDPDELAAKLRTDGFRFSRSTLDRVEANKRHLDVREAQLIARETGVPLTFLVRGWWSPPDLVERVAALEEELSQSRRERDALGRALAALRDTLQTRLADQSETGLEQDQTPADEADRSEEGGRRTP